MVKIVGVEEGVQDEWMKNVIQFGKRATLQLSGLSMCP